MHIEMLKYTCMLFALTHLVQGGEWRTLIEIFSNDGTGLYDLWHNSSYNGTKSYRNIDINNWDLNPPSKIVISTFSINYGYMMEFEFDTTNATSTLDSWLTNGRLEDRLPSRSVLLRKKDLLIISDYEPSMEYYEEKVWFAHIYTTLYGYTTVFTYDENPKLIWREIGSYNFGLETTLLTEDTVYSTSDTTYVDVSLSPESSDFAYIKAVEVLAIEVDRDCTYTINVSDSTYDFTIPDFEELCEDGQRHNLTVFPALRIRFLFSTPVSVVKYKIYTCTPANALIVAPTLLLEGYYDDPIVNAENTEQENREEQQTTNIQNTTPEEGQETTSVLQKTTMQQTSNEQLTAPGQEQETTPELQKTTMKQNTNVYLNFTENETSIIQESTTLPKHFEQQTSLEQQTTIEQQNITISQNVDQQATTEKHIMSSFSLPMMTNQQTRTGLSLTQSVSDTNYKNKTSTEVTAHSTASPSLESSSIKSNSDTYFIETALNVNESNLCQCDCNSQSNLQTWKVLSTAEKEKYIAESINNLTTDLSLNTSKLSATIRRKTSAPDARTSSKMVGCFGVIFLVISFALILVPDGLHLGYHLYFSCQNNFVSE